jgi:predicted RNase H-like nuclease (RuvC/YqgF family)
MNLNLSKRAQDDRRDRLIDSASPEPRVVVQEDGEETMEMMVKQLKERKRQLRGQLDQIKAGMDALETEMEVLGQWR